MKVQVFSERKVIHFEGPDIAWESVGGKLAVFVDGKMKACFNEDCWSFIREVESAIDTDG